MSREKELVGTLIKLHDECGLPENEDDCMGDWLNEILDVIGRIKLERVSCKN